MRRSGWLRSDQRTEAVEGKGVNKVVRWSCRAGLGDPFARMGCSGLQLICPTELFQRPHLESASPSWGFAFMSRVIERSGLQTIKSGPSGAV